jgi:hypothetical protein
MQDKSWMIDMKAEIMRRAQEPSDDEEEEAEYNAYGEKTVRKKRLEPFEDDAWDGLDGGLTSVKVPAGDGEADDESDHQEDTVGYLIRQALVSSLTIVIRHNKTIRSRSKSRQSSNWRTLRIPSCSIVMQ